MTIISIDGPITSITTTPSDRYAIESYSGGATGSPTIVTPSTAEVTVALLAPANTDGSDKDFQMAASFEIGAVIEVYNNDPGRHSVVLLDENSNDITSSSLANPNGPNVLIGSVYRKLSSGSGKNWARVS